MLSTVKWYIRVLNVVPSSTHARTAMDLMPVVAVTSPPAAVKPLGYFLPKKSVNVGMEEWQALDTRTIEDGNEVCAEAHCRHM
jgi:hypothetical protein